MSGSTLSSYKAAAATQIGPLIDLSSDGERQHDWQSDMDLRRDLSNACHVIFPETPAVWFLVQMRKTIELILSLCHLNYVKLDIFRISQDIKGQLKCHIWIFKRWNDGVTQHLEKLVLLLSSLQPNNLKSGIIWMSQDEHIYDSESTCFQTRTITNMGL